MADERELRRRVTRIRQLTARLRHYQDAIKRTKQERAAEIRRLVVEEGWSRRRVGRETGISEARVRQILQEDSQQANDS